MLSETETTEDRDGSGKQLAQSLLWMYALAGISLLIPLLTVPFLARVLGPAAWGRVLCAQAVGALLVVVVEFGFNLNGTRSIAAAARNRCRHRQIVGDVISAKLGCSLMVILIGLVVWKSMPIFDGHGRMVAMTVLWGIAGGLNFGWYFQGTHRPALALTIDVVARLSGAIAIVSLIDAPHQDWLVIALNGAVAVLALMVTAPVVVREVGWPRLSVSKAWSTIRQAGPLASYVLLAGFRNSSNRIVLGFLASPAVVATFGNAERLTELIVRGSEPASRVFYPLMCKTASTAPQEASRVFSRAALFVGAFTMALAAIAIVFAEPIVRLLFGDEYSESVTVLRMLAVFPILKVASMLVNTFWAQPHGLDRHMTPGVLLASAIGILLAVVLVARFDALGMAMAAIASETFFLAWSIGFLAVRGSLPVVWDRHSGKNELDLRRVFSRARQGSKPALAVEELSAQHDHGV